MKTVEALLALAEACGATVYRHRTSPHAPAVAFGDTAWAKFAAALGSPAAPGAPAWPPVAQVAQWALDAIEAGSSAPVVMNVEGVKEHLRRLATGARAADAVPASSPATYTTKPAESLCGIALRQLGDEGRWREISALNADRFPDMLGADYYPVGTVLRMPATSAPAAAAQPVKRN